jgi:hypothetical protein
MDKMVEENKMKNIRRGVFETNSSSVHSLSMLGKTKMYSGKFQKNIILTYGEFGWGHDYLSDPLEKASYLITEYSEDNEMIEKIIKVIEDYTGSEVLILEKNSDNAYYKKGYIDHQSQGMIRDFAYDEDSIRDIIFDEKYSIIIDNDNN